MIRIENENVHGWEAAVRAMRNSHDSWDKSDSEFGISCDICDNPNYDCGDCPVEFYDDKSLIGPNDLDLMKRLAKAGDDESKFMRFIDVTMDITAPLYWWKQFDQYKVGTVSSSTSTMHGIHKKEFKLDDFSCEHLFDDESNMAIFKSSLCRTIADLNTARDLFLETKDKKYWWQMIQLLPESYNQLRTIKLNYQVLRNIYHARKTHKLDEWKEFCKWIETLPYAKELIL